jgi:predicted hydrolase (HD superfamily)
MRAVLIYLAISMALSSGRLFLLGKNFLAEANVDYERASPLFLKKVSDFKLAKHVVRSISEMKPSLSISM